MPLNYITLFWQIDAECALEMVEFAYFHKVSSYLLIGESFTCKFTQTIFFSLHTKEDAKQKFLQRLRWAVLKSKVNMKSTRIYPNLYWLFHSYVKLYFGYNFSSIIVFQVEKRINKKKKTDESDEEEEEEDDEEEEEKPEEEAKQKKREKRAKKSDDKSMKKRKLTPGDEGYDPYDFDQDGDDGEAGRNIRLKCQPWVVTNFKEQLDQLKFLCIFEDVVSSEAFLNHTYQIRKIL